MQTLEDVTERGPLHFSFLAGDLLHGGGRVVVKIIVEIYYNRGQKAL